MKALLQIKILSLFFLCQCLKAQIPLDTVFVSKKRELESFTKIRYYYYPNLEAYFDTRRALYIYKQNGVWITSEEIAPNYRGYCLKNVYYVMLKGYLGDEPYTLLEQHKKEFPADFSSKRKRKVNSFERLVPGI
jgi:hypothetical protein